MKKAATNPTAVSLGTKRTCPKCTLKFYDFSRPSIQCPKCGTEVDPEAALKVLRSPEKKPKPKVVIQDEDEVVPGTPIESFELADDLDDDDGLDEITTDTDSDSDDE